MAESPALSHRDAQSGVYVNPFEEINEEGSTLEGLMNNGKALVG
jgi:hypothetical protein